MENAHPNPWFCITNISTCILKAIESFLETIPTKTNITLDYFQDKAIVILDSFDSRIKFESILALSMNFAYRVGYVPYKFDKQSKRLVPVDKSNWILYSINALYLSFKTLHNIWVLIFESNMIGHFKDNDLTPDQVVTTWLLGPMIFCSAEYVNRCLVGRNTAINVVNGIISGIDPEGTIPNISKDSVWSPGSTLHRVYKWLIIATLAGTYYFCFAFVAAYVILNHDEYYKESLIRFVLGDAVFRFKFTHIAILILETNGCFYVTYSLHCIFLETVIVLMEASVVLNGMKKVAGEIGIQAPRVTTLQKLHNRCRINEMLANCAFGQWLFPLAMGLMTIESSLGAYAIIRGTFKDILVMAIGVAVASASGIIWAYWTAGRLYQIPKMSNEIKCDLIERRRVMDRRGWESEEIRVVVKSMRTLQPNVHFVKIGRSYAMSVLKDVLDQTISIFLTFQM